MENFGARLTWFASSETGYTSLVFNLLQATWTAWTYRKARKRVSSSSALEMLVGTFVLGFGGSTMTAIILGKPWGWVQVPTLILIYTFIALAMHYSPSDSLFRILSLKSHFLEPIFIVNDSLSKTLAIIYSGSQLVLKQGSGELTNYLVSSVLCGTIAGCGGGILFNMLGLSDPKWKFQCPEQLHKPSIAMILSFIAAILYTTNHFGLLVSFGKPLTQNEAIAIIFIMISSVSLMIHMQSLGACRVSKKPIKAERRLGLKKH